MSEGRLRVTVHRLRKRYRELLRLQIATPWQRLRKWMMSPVFVCFVGITTLCAEGIAARAAANAPPGDEISCNKPVRVLKYNAKHLLRESATELSLGG
jgi:hypothetical protein